MVAYYTCQIGIWGGKECEKISGVVNTLKHPCWHLAWRKPQPIQLRTQCLLHQVLLTSWSLPTLSLKTSIPFIQPSLWSPSHVFLFNLVSNFFPKKKKTRLESGNIHGQVQVDHIQLCVPSLPNWSSCCEITRVISKTVHWIRDTLPKYLILQWRWSVARDKEFPVIPYVVLNIGKYNKLWTGIITVGYYFDSAARGGLR